MSYMKDNAGTRLDTIEVATKPSVDAKAPRGLPSYVASTITGIYDAKFNAFNWKPSNTRKAKAAQGRGAAGGMGEYMIIGDSGGAGCTNGITGAFDRARSWPMEMGKELARHGIPIGGTGLVRVVDRTYVDSRWGASAGWTTSSFTYAYTATNGAWVEFTTDKAGDKIQVWTYDGNDGATCDVTRNGVALGTITSSGPTVNWRSTTYSATVAVGDKIRITKTGGTLVGVKGAGVYTNNGGLIVHNVSQSGSNASKVGTRECWSDYSAVDRLGTVYDKVTTANTNTPDVVICALLGNDLQGGVAAQTPAQVMAGLTDIRNHYAASDFILCAEFPLNTTLIPAANYEAGVAAMYALAETLDVPLIDWRARVGSYATTVANGLTNDTQGHLLAPGYVDLGRNLGMLLAS